MPAVRLTDYLEHRTMRACGYLVLVALGLAPVGFSRSPAQGPDKKASAKIEYAKDVAAFLTKYCTSCHGGAKPKADLSLDKFIDEETALKARKIWEKVTHNLRSGEMPPDGRKKPTLDEVERVTAWVDTKLLQIDCTKQRDPGRVTIRRLNKAEYNNTIRDLIGITFKPADDFPSDDVGYGFDNIGDVLTMSPLLLEKYLAAAERVVELAWKTPAARQKILIEVEGAKDNLDKAKGIIASFAKRAYRRPLLPGEVERLARFVELAEKNRDSFEKGIQLAVQAALVSPHFLFRIERDRPPKKNVPDIFPIGSYELASRLSYFLWSSMPDDELFGLAERAELRQPKVLEAQVKRMLRDPKALALTENFAGQWLTIRSLREHAPDPKTYPAFDKALRAAMVTETEMFFEHMVREDRQILEFLDADYSFVNERLAKHYGIAGVKGDEFRKVSLKGTQRAGILTHASILTVTSNPTRTSPVKRGKWVLDNIFNTPPPPPIPDAGELEEGAEQELKGTLRQRMETHRAKPICASCHQRMDPIGFGFENFDGVGAWRTKEGKFPIDSSGTLPSGQSFKGPLELVTILKTREADFRRCLSEKLLTYALGRGLEYYDKCAVDDIAAAVAKNEYRFSSLVLAIVNSDPFQLRKARQR
jgi:mono/diheme cytochrome c family protein/uncharacterized protein (DUF2384 family)